MSATREVGAGLAVPPFAVRIAPRSAPLTVKFDAQLELKLNGRRLPSFGFVRHASRTSRWKSGHYRYQWGLRPLEPPRQHPPVTVAADADERCWDGLLSLSAFFGLGALVVLGLFTAYLVW